MEDDVVRGRWRGCEIEICGGKDVRSGSGVGDVGCDYYSHIIIIEEPRVESTGGLRSQYKKNQAKE